jgi:3-methyladenine DNA glycosylase AlkD
VSVPLTAGGSGYHEGLVGIDMVVKALSWSLRELAKHDPAPVTSFLAVEQARLAARVKREVGNKLTTGVKTPSRAAARRR